MIDLSALAGELDALVRDGRRIRLGDRNFEKPHAELDELLGRMRQLADRARVGVIGAAFAADGKMVLPASVITGRGQVIVCAARGLRR
ncbi:TubC N-terminal docking domain-containing protein [Methylorubrum aminovorans]